MNVSWRTRIVGPLISATGLLVGSGAQAHHSYSEFDATQTVEIEGALVVLAWQNPHTHMEVRVLDASNRAVVWDVETGPVNSMRRQGAPLEAFKIGDVVKVAGWPSKRSANRLYATNLLGGGRELLFQTATPRWPGSVVTHSESFNNATSIPAAAGRVPTLFRVWVSDPARDPETRPGFLTRAQVSLTATAQKAVASFDPVTQSITSGCAPKGMPVLMGQPFPIELLDRGDTIVLNLEEYDARRTIHMTRAAQPDSEPSSPLGYSAGRWDGSTLVVETGRLDSPYFNSAGVPLGKSARTLERFTVSDDGLRLSYTLTVIDPETFTEPAQASRAWVAKDGEQLLPYDCKAPRY
ncbi:MAG TPA: DUF6152 family protein [Gammaproteobacteria bacterium]|nr:DUF6152 family protein [Gammaproteobacteria bacterium]